MLKTLIVCLAGCGAPTSISDELGRVSAEYLQTCHELQQLRRAHCPELAAPALLQCVNDVERELPSRYRGEFRKGLRVLEERFQRELPAEISARFNTELNSVGGDTALACGSIAARTDHRRLQLQKQLRGFANGR